MAASNNQPPSSQPPASAPAAPPPPPPAPTDMTAADYAKILLDSSFKESATTWARTGALLTFNSVLFGFYVNYVKDNFDNAGKPPALGFAAFGVLAAILNIFLVRISVHYNVAWYDSFKCWALKQSKLSSSTSAWRDLENHITRHDTLPGPGFHASDIAWYLAWLILFIWSIVSILYGYNAYKAFTNPGFPSMDYS